jgi:hypothetical protein
MNRTPIPITFIKFVNRTIPTSITSVVTNSITINSGFGFSNTTVYGAQSGENVATFNLMVDLLHQVLQHKTIIIIIIIILMIRTIFVYRDVKIKKNRYL